MGDGLRMKILKLCRLTEKFDLGGWGSLTKNHYIGRTGGILNALLMQQLKYVKKSRHC